MELDINGLYQHQKHDPKQGKYHQYQLLFTTTAATSSQGHGAPTALACLERVFHTDPDQAQAIWWLCGNAGPLKYLYCKTTGRWATGPFCIYVNVLNPTGPYYARPMEEFIDGRFSTIDFAEVVIPSNDHAPRPATSAPLR